MVIAVVALIFGVLLGGFILIPRKRKSVQIEKAYSNAGGIKVIFLSLEQENGWEGRGVCACAYLYHDQLYDVKSTVIYEGRRDSLACLASKTFSKAEVSLHNKRTDCWIIIKDKVYDVTSYVEEHPGGDAILAHAGDDSTEGFFGPQHATRVFDMIEDFYIGDLER
ncbi:unnamed protein product [Dovyalis caffra]|uniref:Cytochrome b5 heme-binding domain-containing protein n=1 Tax=Dovyalis caffra TaxID=77055 RepID=A0AAV1RQH0_9ROSI|nr:unnamed protein product [Dovyalis caffra]